MIPLNLLVAFPYFSKSILEILKRRDHAGYRLMVDSGAFTAHMSGEPIQLDDYCKFLDAIACVRPFNAVQLDVIGDHEASLRNYEIMRARGYDVLPVFTRGAPLEMLDHLFSLSEYVLVGGVAVGDKRQGYVKWLMPKIQKRKVHLLGFTDLDFVKAYRPYSIDSSGWSAGERYGRVSIYTGQGRFKVMTKAEVHAMPFLELCRIGLHSKLQAHHLDLLKHADAWRNLANNDLSERSACTWLSGYAYVVQCADIEKNLGTKSYLAIATDRNARRLFAAHDLYWRS